MRTVNNAIRNRIEKLAQASGIAVSTFIIYSNSGIDKKGGEAIYKQLCNAISGIEGKISNLKIN